MTMELFGNELQPKHPTEETAMVMPKELWQFPVEKRGIALGILNDLYGLYVHEKSIRIDEETHAKTFASSSLFGTFSMDAREKFINDGRIVISSKKREKGDISSVDLINMISSYIQDSRGIRIPQTENRQGPVLALTASPRKKHRPLRATTSATTTFKPKSFSTKMRAANDDSGEHERGDMPDLFS